MNDLLEAVRTRRGAMVGMATGGIALLTLGILVFRPVPPREENQSVERRLFVQAKRAVSGQKLRIDDDKDEYVILNGIRAPFGGEEFQQESTTRADKLVHDKEVRLRFDDERRDKEGRLLAYVFVGDTFVNEELVRDGLAYVRATTAADRFSKRLLEAQAEAQKARRGVWAQHRRSDEKSYVGDRKYGNFHRPSCEETGKIPPDRSVHIKSLGAAYDAGFAPCSKCKP